MSKLAVIVGSGLDKLLSGRKAEVTTPYGKATVLRGKLDGKPFIFLPRHGPNHSVPPHKINHRANVFALAELGATDLLSISAVGIVDKKGYKVGNLIIIRDYFDMKAGPTLFNRFKDKPMHAAMGEPYSPELIKKVQKAARLNGVKLKDGAVLTDTTGPRFETAHEIFVMGLCKVDLVGMTSVGETIIANELRLMKLEIRNATLGIATNYGTGLVKSFDHSKVEAVVKKREDDVKGIIYQLVHLV